MQVHLLYQLAGIHRGVQQQESRPEAGRESRRGFLDAAFGAGHLGGITAQELILGLVGIKPRNGRQHAESVGGEENHLARMAALRHRLHDIVDVVNRVGDTGVFGLGSVVVVDFARLGVEHHVFQKRIALDGAENIGFVFFGEVDALGVAAAFEIEHAFVVPAVFVITDKLTFGVGRKGGLARSRKPEENGRVAVFAHVGRAVHGGHALERQKVVHHREEAFLHFPAVPRAADYGSLFVEVKGHVNLAVHAFGLIVWIGGLAGVEHHEVGLEVFQFLFGGADKHVLGKMRLPGHFRYDTDAQTAVGVRAHVTVLDIQFLVRKFLARVVVQLLPQFGGDSLVVRTLAAFLRPPHVLFGSRVAHNVLVFGRTAGKDAGIHRHGAGFGKVATVKAIRTGSGFMLEKLLVRKVVKNFLGAGNTIAFQVFHQFLHFHDTFFLVFYFSPPVYRGIGIKKQAKIINKTDERKPPRINRLSCAPRWLWERGCGSRANQAWPNGWTDSRSSTCPWR